MDSYLQLITGNTESNFKHYFTTETSAVFLPAFRVPTPITVKGSQADFPLALHYTLQEELNSEPPERSESGSNMATNEKNDGWWEI